MINAYDIETFEEKNKFIPYCVFFYLDDKKKFYYNNSGNENIIFKSIQYIFYNMKNKHTIFYIHNLNFDGSLIIEYLSNFNNIEIESIIKNNNLYSLTIINQYKKIEFKCSYKLIPLSLKKIAKEFNLNQKMIFPYKFAKKENLTYIGNIPNKEYFESKEEYELFTKKNKIFNFKYYSILYCMQDVIITKSFVKIILDICLNFKININTDKIYSTSGLSLNIFMKKFNKNKINLKYNKDLDSLIRPSYFGGRCETFGNIKENESLYHFDFSGMYAQCMMENFCIGTPKIKFSNIDIAKPGFYSIKFKSENMHIPILPHHHIKNKKLMFTNGILEGTYWFEEINYFIKNKGIILDVNYGVEYEQFGKCFNDFIEYFTEIKNKGGVYKTFGKLIMNSLYGRFGMNEEEEYSFFVKEDEIEWWFENFEIISCSNINKIYLLKIKINNKLKKKIKNITKKKTQSNISLASAISSKARIKLLTAFKDVTKEGGSIKYCDTDSLFVGFKKNVLNMKHGEVFWDESKNDTKINNSIFILPKMYGISYNIEENNIIKEKEIIKIKGITKPNIELKSLKKKFYNNENIFSFTQNQFNKKNMIINLEKVEKNININLFNKRIWNKEKNETKPYYYENGEYL